MELQFSKMHGLGNDFIVIDAISQTVNFTKAIIKRLADRHLGIGFDQCLVVEPAQSNDTEFFYRIYNADGNEVAQCGNGARCLAMFIKQRGLSSNNPILVGTKTRRMCLEFIDETVIKVDIGQVELAPKTIPFKQQLQQEYYPINVDGSIINLQVLNVGNPHAVITVNDTERTPVAQLGPAIQALDDFPESVNVGFMQIIDKHNIRLRVYERGAGETMACGSGACAAVAAGILAGKLDYKVNVHLPAGQLIVEWSGGEQVIYLSGPAVHVFDGVVQL